MSYKVTMQYPNGVETPCKDLEFKDLKTAEAEIINKMRVDADMRIQIIYRIREWDDLIKEFDPKKYALPTEESTSSSQGQGAGSRPTPLSTIPRPPGSPQTWQKSGDDEEEKR